MHRLLRRNQRLSRLLRPLHIRRIASVDGAVGGGGDIPVYLGASYFNFSLALRDVYVAYENWSARTGRADLATHYLIVGEH